MKRLWIFMILMACPVMTLGQGNGSGSSTLGQGSKSRTSGSPPYQPAVPPSSATVYGGGDWGYCGVAQTPAGAALQGMSQVVSSAGQYNLATSAAAVNMTQAESNEIHNLIQGTQTFWEMRDLGRMERDKERGPRPTPEELARRAHAAAPLPLSAIQVDRASGAVNWPATLLDESFLAQRVAVDEYMAVWARYGRLEHADQTQVHENIDAMFDTLKLRIASIPPQDYVECRTFLESLLFATTRSAL